MKSKRYIHKKKLAMGKELRGAVTLGHDYGAPDHNKQKQ
jgi:hypothetical protein